MDVAIVGLGCRFAGGVTSPELFWSFLMSGSRAVGEVPDGRWDAAWSKSRENAAVLSRVTSRGAFLDDISGFDNAFFGVSGTEAEQLDPQQRVALEVAWEALEHAGIDPTKLAGTDTGVFMGVGSDDYGRRLLEDLPEVRAWTGIGASACAVANRISYTLDLRGPSFSVDTACSSSLVALNQACRSVASGESPLALAGGVMLMSGPGLTAVLDEAGAISPDGRSKAFSDAADGYGRGEGCGVVVVKRLSDALADGDHVWAVVRGGAVRQDGRTDGIMAPSREAQEHLLRAAYADAGVDPREVGYVEAHGTGTRVGDPIEVGALSTVVGEGGCLVGSVKTNLGHTEAAAGIAGVIKTVLALDAGVIPPTVLDAGLRQDIDWAGLEVVTSPRPLESRFAGVASYGYGGTIAHVVLEQGSSRAPSPVASPGLRVYPVSGGSPDAVREQASRLVSAIGERSLADVGHTLAHRRAHLPTRAAVVASDHATLTAGLESVSPVASTASDVVWVFSGHGAQWSGMGRSLLADSSEFAAVIDRLEPIFLAELGVSPREVLESGSLGGVDCIQSMLFAMQIGLAAVLTSRGVRPAAVIGHSVGEIAAAVVAGSLTEEQGARLVCRRSRLLPLAAGQGAMAMVDMSFSTASSLLAGRTDVVPAIAAAPASTVLAGTPAALDSFLSTLDGHVVRRVDSDVAFHSPQMEPLAVSLASAVADLSPSVPSVPLYVTAVADPRSAPRQDASYWAQNLRNPVLFKDAVEAAVEDGFRVFLEVSAHPVVSHSINEVLGGKGAVVPCLRRNKPELAGLLAAVASLYCHGVDVDWSVLQPDGVLADLPGVAWQHKRHWVSGPSASFPADTLLGTPVTVHGSSTRVWNTTLNVRTRPYPGRHPVLETEIVPAAVLLNTFLTAGECSGLRDVSLRNPVVVPSSGAREVQIVRDGNIMRIVSDGAVTTSALLDFGSGTGFSVDACTELAPDYVISRLAELGVAAMGYPWRFSELRRGDDVLCGQMITDAPGWASVLDAALSMASVVFDGPAVLRMPSHLARFGVSGTAPSSAAISVRVSGPSTVDVWVSGVGGSAWFEGLRYGELAAEADSLAELRYSVDWCSLPEGDSVPLSSVSVLGDPKLAAALGVPEGTSGSHVLCSVDSVSSLLSLVRSHSSDSRLWCVTSSASLMGVSRVLASEHPDFWGGAIELPSSLTALDVSALARALSSREPVLAVRDGSVFVPRLTPVSGSASFQCSPSGTYLITGGFGALGLEMASHLAQRGARRLVLLGRTPLPPRALWPSSSPILALEAAGVTVFPVAADIADLSSVRSALEAVQAPPITGVVHAAGIVHSGLVGSLSSSDIDAVMRPKVAGACVLDALFPPGSLEFMVFFSSAGPLLGLPGQAAYAAANAFLDDLACRRGGETVSLAWTSWRGLGMSTSAAATDVELAARGTADITAAQALRAFDQSVGCGENVVAVLRVLREHAGPRPLVLSSVVASSAPVVAASVVSTVSVDSVGEIVAGVLGVDASVVGESRALSELGVDSLLASAVRVELEKAVGVALPATLLWNYPSVGAIVGYLSGVVPAGLSG
ncbi:type I polyketide synthase [Allokutzneria multivorans]|uniref:Type I polyketide synthase n=1 Tax=Allokutzneria multivorans TaxID=1142134 RepID=A0ABP7S067_9PSEU